MRTMVLDVSSARRAEGTATTPVGFTALTRPADKVLLAHVPFDCPGPVRLYADATNRAEYALKYPGDTWIVMENSNGTIPFYYASTDGTTVYVNVVPAQ